jgi:hypothetical protein
MNEKIYGEIAHEAYMAASGIHKWAAAAGAVIAEYERRRPVGGRPLPSRLPSDAEKAWLKHSANFGSLGIQGHAEFLEGYAAARANMDINDCDS